MLVAQVKFDAFGAFYIAIPFLKCFDLPLVLVGGHGVDRVEFVNEPPYHVSSIQA
ncbi:hypothetical protein D3C80_1499850 [compost metagenome]